MGQKYEDDHVRNGVQLEATGSGYAGKRLGWGEHLHAARVGAQAEPRQGKAVRF